MHSTDCEKRFDRVNGQTGHKYGIQLVLLRGVHDQHLTKRRHNGKHPVVLHDVLHREHIGSQDAGAGILVHARRRAVGADPRHERNEPHQQIAGRLV